MMLKPAYTKLKMLLTAHVKCIVLSRSLLCVQKTDDITSYFANDNHANNMHMSTEWEATEFFPCSYQKQIVSHGKILILRKRQMKQEAKIAKSNMLMNSTNLDLIIKQKQERKCTYVCKFPKATISLEIQWWGESTDRLGKTPAGPHTHTCTDLKFMMILSSALIFCTYYIVTDLLMMKLTINLIRYQSV